MHRFLYILGALTLIAIVAAGIGVGVLIYKGNALDAQSKAFVDSERSTDTESSLGRCNPPSQLPSACRVGCSSQPTNATCRNHPSMPNRNDPLDAGLAQGPDRSPSPVAHSGMPGLLFATHLFQHQPGHPLYWGDFGFQYSIQSVGT